MRITFHEAGGSVAGQVTVGGQSSVTAAAPAARSNRLAGQRVGRLEVRVDRVMCSTT